jgi:radical SAM superfamily enzyme YgiQ (UPF0313 family)
VTSVNFSYLSQVTSARARAPAERRVLLVMPPDIAPAAQPHLGLGILAARLRTAGFAPLVVDYAFRPSLPPIEWFLSSFEPAAVGVSVFSQGLTKTAHFVRRVRASLPRTPIILGGPHITISEDQDLLGLRSAGADILVKGEADEQIVPIMEALDSGRPPGIVCCQPADMSKYTWPDFTTFVGGLELSTYPQQLSRGCPYQCIFCNVKRIAGRKFRPRAVEDAIDEIELATRTFPNLRFVKVTDDAPNVVPERVERFLELYTSRRLPPRLEIMQLRADNLTPGIARLLKAAGAPYIVVGVEAGDEALFASVKKGETIADIRRACGFVQAADLPLVMCFVLGLPGATPDRDRASIRLAREMRPVHCYWNVAQPMPGTEMFEFFQREGRILRANVAEESSLDGGCFADTPAYPAIDRLRLQVEAQASTNERAGNWQRLLLRGTRLGAPIRTLKALSLARPTIPADAERRW